MAKPNKENVITDILIELNGTNGERAEILAKVGKKWQLATRTFDRYWQIASERHKIAVCERNKAINEQSVANTLESLQSLNISRNSLLQQLEDVKTDCFVPDAFGKINASAIIKAIEVQAKMLGLNEPEKQEIIVKSGVNSVIIE